MLKGKNIDRKVNMLKEKYWKYIYYVGFNPKRTGEAKLILDKIHLFFCYRK